MLEIEQWNFIQFKGTYYIYFELSLLLFCVGIRDCVYSRKKNYHYPYYIIKTFIRIDRARGVGIYIKHV